MLPFGAETLIIEVQQEEVKQKIEYVCKRPNHYGRAKLPSHLPVEEFERAMDNDRARAEKGLLMIQKLYAVERKIRENGLTANAVKDLRWKP